MAVKVVGVIGLPLVLDVTFLNDRAGKTEKDMLPWQPGQNVSLVPNTFKLTVFYIFFQRSFYFTFTPKATH